MHILEVIILTVASFVLTIPFWKFPPDDHFANYTSWALFRKEGEPLPSYFLLLNQGGFCRIFLYYLAALMIRIVGRRHLLLGLRVLATLLNSFIALSVYFIAKDLLAADSLMAFIASLIFLYISTRPQFELLKYNPELFHVAGAMLAAALILSLWPDGSRSVWWLLPVFIWLVFVGFNCKILFCLDSAAMTLALFICTGFNIQILLVYLLSIAIALALFMLLYRKISIQNLFSLHNYLEFFNNQNIFQNFKYNYKTFYYKTPLLGYFLLYFIGLSACIPHSKFTFMLFWSISTIAIVIQQKRFCTYFFQICFAPACIPIAVGLSKLNSIYTPIPFLILAGFVVLSWRSLRDFAKYYFNKPAIEHTKTTYESFYNMTSYDFRVDDIVEHYGSHGEPFIVWQTDLLSHYMTNQPPICLIGSMVYHAHVMYPQRQKMLIDAALEKKPAWVYDFSGSYWGNYQFNPLSFYLSCGIGFVPRMKKNNILYYQFEKRASLPLGTINNNMQLYVIHTILLDTFIDEIRNICGSEVILPANLHKDLSELCIDLIKGKSLTVTSFPEHHLEEALQTRPNVGMLYLCALALGRGDKEAAARRLIAWEKTSRLFFQMYPPLSFSILFLQALCGIRSNEFEWPQVDIFDVSFPRDALLVFRLSEKLAESSVLSQADKTRLLAYFQDVSLEDTVYKYFYTENLKAILEKLEQKVVAAHN